MKTFNLEDSDCIAILGGLHSYRAELMEEATSDDEDERETAKADLPHVERLIKAFTE